MNRLVRFGISTEKELLDKFDRLMKGKGYSNRSKAFSDLVRQELVKKEWEEGKEVAGAITLIYDHHRRELVNTVISIQHDFQENIIANQHVHIDHDNCLEIMAVKGSPKEITELAGRLRAVKGVKHGDLSMSSTGKGI